MNDLHPVLTVFHRMSNYGTNNTYLKNRKNWRCLHNHLLRYMREKQEHANLSKVTLVHLETKPIKIGLLNQSGDRWEE